MKTHAERNSQAGGAANARGALTAWGQSRLRNHGAGSSFFPLFSGQVLGGRSAGDTLDPLPGARQLQAAEALVVMLLAPWLGAYADRRGQEESAGWGIF